MAQLCPIGFKLGVGEAFEGPFAESFEPSDETEKLLVQASQLDGSQVRQAARMPRSLARSTICFPAVGAFIGGTYATGYYTGNIGGSFAATALVHVCMCGATSCTDATVSGTIDDFGSQQLEHSSEEPVQQAPPINVGESFAAIALVHVCMCGFVIFGSY